MASGNVVHNLRRVDWNQPDDGFDWAKRFDDAARGLMTSSPAEVVGLSGHRDYGVAVPTPDHFLPLLYLAGLAQAEGIAAEVLVEGFAYGSLSMTSYVLGGHVAVVPGTHTTGGSLPDPELVPTDESNA